MTRPDATDGRRDLVDNAERVVLSAALSNQQHCQQVLAELSAEDFAPRQHGEETNSRLLFHLIADAARRGNFGHVEVVEEAIRQERLQDVGGAHHLSELAVGPVPYGKLDDRMATVREAGYRRRMIAAGKRIQEAAADFGTEWGKLTGLALNQMLDVNVGSEEAVGIIRVEDLEADADRLYADGSPPRGVTTGWGNLDGHYRPRRGRWTVVTGIPGSGKSTWLDALAVNLAKEHGWRVGFCSPEKLPTHEHLAELAQVWTGKPFFDGPTPRMGDATWAEGKRAVAEHFAWVMPPPDSRTPDSVLALATLLHRQSPLDGLVIDPWNELDHDYPPSQSETNYISQALTTIRSWARTHDVHVWLVAHPTKQHPTSDGTYRPPRPYDISGCHTADTDVLTRRGWVRHPDVKADDEVAAFDGDTHTLRWTRPSKIWTYNYAGPVHHYRGYGFDCRVTPGHRMMVRPGWMNRDPRRTEWEFIRSEDLPTSQWHRPRCAPVEQQVTQDVSLDRMWFLGFYLAEGHNSMGAPSVGQAPGPILDEAVERLDRIGVDYCVTIRPPHPSSKAAIQDTATVRVYARKSPEFSKWVLSNAPGVAGDKRIPRWAFGCSRESLRALLDGLLAGDGNIRANGGQRYSTTSPGLADDVHRLAVYLGYCASLRHDPKPDPNHSDQWTVELGRPDVDNVAGLRLPRQRTTEQYRGTVHCLTVETGAYLTRRDGRIAITGNSANWSNKADNAITVHRDRAAGDRNVDVHVTKVRFQPWEGTEGKTTLKFDPRTGRYRETSGGF